MYAEYKRICIGTTFPNENFKELSKENCKNRCYKLIQVHSYWKEEMNNLEDDTDLLEYECNGNGLERRWPSPKYKQWPPLLEIIL